MHLHIMFVLLSMFFRVWKSFDLLCVIILDITKRRARALEATPTASHTYHPKRRIKQEYLAVAHLLLPIFNLLLPSTIYIVC